MCACVCVWGGVLVALCAYPCACMCVGRCRGYACTRMLGCGAGGVGVNPRSVYMR